MKTMFGGVVTFIGVSRLFFLAVSAGAAFGLSAPPAIAQDKMSADSMIQHLKPVGPLGGGTRGIRPTNEPTPPPPSLTLNIQFDNGSDNITPEAAQTLDRLGQALSSPDLSGYRFRIEGHTDTVGSAGYNQDLSDRRARRVAEYIAGKYKVDHTRLQPVGMGKDGLLVPTPDETAEPRNRRVQIVNIGSQDLTK